jgi:light-harvesting complex 1 beta chain
VIQVSSAYLLRQLADHLIQRADWLAGLYVDCRLSFVDSNEDRAFVVGADQSGEVHEQYKIMCSACVGIAALVHLFILGANPWFRLFPGHDEVM